MSQRSIWKRAWYSGLKVLCRQLCVVFFRLRIQGREHIPPVGGALVLSTHQSHLDPMLVGIGFNRRLNFVARETLFRFAPFRWFIQSLDAIPLDREGLGLSGLKETMRRLKHGEMVLLFPEGTRTRDGHVARIKPGFCILARKVKVPLVPLAVVGSFEAWPRTQQLPWFSTVQIQIGEPLSPAQFAGLTDEQLIAEIQSRLEQADALAREGIRRAGTR